MSIESPLSIGKAASAPFLRILLPYTLGLILAFNLSNTLLLYTITALFVGLLWFSISNTRLYTVGLFAFGFFNLTTTTPTPFYTTEVRPIVQRLSVELEHRLSPESASFLQLLLLRNNEHKGSKALKEQFINMGCYHLLVVSGLHMSFIALVLSQFLRLLLPNWNSIRLSLVLLTLFLYLLLLNFPISATRACIMTGILLSAHEMKKESAPWNGYFASAFLILVIWPYSFSDIGFQLSFLAVGTLFLCIQVLSPFGQRWNKWARNLLHAVGINIGIHLTVTPLLLFYFGETSLMGLWSNFIFSPLIYIVLVLSLATFAFSWIPGLNLCLYTLLDKGVEFTLCLTHQLAPFGNKHFIHASVNSTGLVLYLSGILLLLSYPAHKSLKSLYVASLFLLLCFLIPS